MINSNVSTQTEVICMLRKDKSSTAKFHEFEGVMERQ